MKDWKEEYESLARFVAENPGIVLTPAEISIPQDLREEFYLRFDNIRAALVDMQYSALPVDIDSLCSRYMEIEKEVIGILGIEKITMPVDLFSFLHTPKAGLARILYNGLFDLAQGKTTPDAFESRSVADLCASASELFRLGYEWWAALTLIKCLDPDQSFRVDLDSDYKPVLAELKEISFGRQAHHPTMRIPEFVLHSQKLGRYVAVKMAIAREVETYYVQYTPPVRPKKRTGDTSSALDSRVMLLSFMPSPEQIPVIADIYDRTLNSPDWIVEFITESEFLDPDAREQVRVHLNALKPTRGIYLVLMDHESGEVPQAADNIHPVPVGFDEIKIQSVVEALG